MNVLPAITVDFLNRCIAKVILAAVHDGSIDLLKVDWDLMEVAAAMQRRDLEELKYISVKFDKWFNRNLTRTRME